MSLRERCESYFGTQNLYEVLRVPETATAANLKKAYKKLSLEVHPDRVAPDAKEEATKKFQVLSAVYYILSNEEKRVLYDESGVIEEEGETLQNKDWESYFRLLFPKLTEDAVDKFLDKYKGSDEELEDLKKLYVQHEGDMDKITQCLIGFTVVEEPRIRRILEGLIEEKELPTFPKFTDESAAKKKKRQKRYEKEAKEAAKLQKTMDKRGSLDLAPRSRQKQQDDFIKSLEEKYCKK